MDKAKRAFWIILTAFILYAIFTSPEQAASVVRTIWDIIANGFRNLGHFFNSILRK